MGAQQIVRDKPRATPPKLPFARGFILMELTVVLVIVALLLGGLLIPLSAQRDGEAIRGTEKYLADIRDALLGFAVANGRLPCPRPPAATASKAFAATPIPRRPA